ncbi:MAG: methylmalonyl-CoA carboxyltransferase [Candidatus Edwardsbacteria bacterium]|nr:methylmalonyl-CoA carboxyltransferase [Candidatus Edwardsbacteria bacterium]MBU1576075.1 methylmalonyl-CoA carboxyltransferase [Candidatus Edwardsbacteria bacterium]MBU2463677.1 methylmalonyl-CoA carboxyltransferase [Candidatus Edwardsbacteria bacterium]MBU2594145.1 methylmalonyl-CoA carboxyltransferase [Candidatus Edwardsbacteria bacterium]
MSEKTIEQIIKALEDQKAVICDADGKRAAKQHDKGKLSARERLDLLLDPQSFVEFDAFVKHRCDNFGMDKVEIPADGVVTGYGTIEGRPVFVFSQDFTVTGGSLGEAHALKIVKMQDMALKMGVPVIGINDSGGARIQEGVDSLRGYGMIFFRNTRASGVIPQISVILGPCAGGAVYSPAITDFVFMVDKVSNMYITGPQVIKAVMGEDVGLEELGGAQAHNAVSGNGHFIYPSEEDCFAGVRKLITLIPANNLEDPPVAETGDQPAGPDMEMRNIVPVNPKMPYDVKDIIARVVDNGDFLEVHQLFALNIVVGLGRIAGQTVGIVANQPLVMAGCLDINSSDKAARFIRFCDAFNIPLVTFVDCPGYLPGKQQEHGGIIRHGAKILFAYSEATVPKITVTLRKSYGGAHIAMCNKDLGSDLMLAWPQSEIAVMGASGAVNVIFRKQIEAAEDKNKRRQELIDEYETMFSNPYEAAKRGYVDAVISPEETRGRIVSALAILKTKREQSPAKKHGNIPL